MKTRDLISLSLLFILLNSSFNFAQSSEFNPLEYQEYINNHQNLTSDDLLNLHPAGEFYDNVHQQTNWALYYDSVETKYSLTEYEKELIEQNGFVVTERLNNRSFVAQFLDVFGKDLPVFISADAILHALHQSYDKILQEVELTVLIDKLTELLTALQQKMPELETRYAGNNDMLVNLKDVDVYITTPLKILNPSTSPYFAENNDFIDELLGFITEQNPRSVALFGGTQHNIDFSQFKPRGHYSSEEYPELAKYFKAMMWLGRIEIYLLAPASTIPDVPEEDIKRQTIDAILLTELFELSSYEEVYSKMEEIIAFFVGEQDNVTLPNLNELKIAVPINDAAQLKNDDAFHAFQDSLKTKTYAFQQIQSQILMRDPYSPDSVVPASAFMLFGQRFIVDSYVTGSVVYDKIESARMLPSSLDVMFALGNNAAAQLLQDEVNQYGYASQLAWLRYLVDSYGAEYWDSTIYNMWLNSIRCLNPPEDKSNLPKFMKAGAWWQQKMNTQLASWTELRHDNVLYAKQSYTSSITCEYPYGYVEPVPQFFNSIKNLAENTAGKFVTIEYTSALANSVINYFDYFAAIADTLSSIAQNELNGIENSEAENLFLKTVISSQMSGCEWVYKGWYRKLFYDRGDWEIFNYDYLVVDYHTSPTDEYGNPVGWVKHAGTGPIDLAVIIAPLPDGQNCTFVGPVSSYYEYTSTNFFRLTDEEWTATYLNQALRPDWVNVYLADEQGNSRGPGLSLITGIQENPTSENEIPTSSIIAQNYPNPFNTTTIISFTVPFDYSNSLVELNIYDIQGSLIAQLINENLPAGNYLTRWNGKNQNGTTVASGVYFYQIRAGNLSTIGKMSLLK